MQKLLLFFILFMYCTLIVAQRPDPFKPDPGLPEKIKGMELVWSDEFNTDGKPDPGNWTHEKGFIRNQELQWYQPDNANCSNGVLVIEGRREMLPNPNYKEGSSDWRSNRQLIEYTSSGIKTQGLQLFQFGRLDIRARIDTTMSAWPAIWTLGTNGRWPLGGEADIMEFYRSDNIPMILANLAWGRNENGGPVWNTKKIPLSHFTSHDPDWVNQFHIWRMDWTRDSISLYLDDELLNTGVLNQMLNPDGSDPFLQPHYLLLNLALGGNGGNPASSKFPIKYEIDYVRYYKKL